MHPKKLVIGYDFNYDAYVLQVRVETDPSDRTQMRLTVASEDPNTTYEYYI